MGFIYDIPSVPKIYENHIVCIVTWEDTIYPFFIDDIIVDVYFILF